MAARERDDSGAWEPEGGAEAGAGAGDGGGVDGGSGGGGASGGGSGGSVGSGAADGAGLPGDDVRLAWVRVRLRAARHAALATFGLVLVTAFLAAGLPRSVDRYEDRALQHAVRAGQYQDRGIALTESYNPQQGLYGTNPLDVTTLDAVQSAVHSLLARTTPLAPHSAVYGARTGQASEVPDPGLPRPSSHPPTADLVAQADLGAHARLVAGRMPQPPPAVSDGQRPPPIDAAVTLRTARKLHLKVGQTVHPSGTNSKPLTVHITGIVAPLDPTSSYWNEDPDLLGPVLGSQPGERGEEPKAYWHFTLLTHRDAADSLPELGAGVNVYWYEPLDIGRLTAHGVPALQNMLSSLSGGPLAVKLQDASGAQLSVSDALGTVLTGFLRERDATTPLVLIAAVGVATTALAVLLMAGGLAAERRRVEIALLRARGGSLRGVTGRLAAETAAAAVPGGVAGALLALLLLPTGRWLLPVLLAALVTAVVVLALPLRAAFAVRRPGPGGREDVVSARPSRRRLVVELTVVVLVVGAVVALRQRGGGSSGGTATGGGSGPGNDPFLAAAPVLVAIGAALVLLRLYPVPLRLLARPAARLTGAVTHLGLARAGRSPATGQLPLLAVLVALTVTSFGGSVLAGINHGRDRAATATVGADARIDAVTATLSPQLPGRVQKVPGIGMTTTARVEQHSADATFNGSYAVVLVDPAAYDKLTGSVGLPSFPAHALSEHGGQTGQTEQTGQAGQPVLPAVLSPGLARQIGRKTVPVATDLGSVSIRTAAVLPTTPAAPGGDFVIVSAAALKAMHPEAEQYPQQTAPTTLLAMAAPGRHIDAKALREVAASDVSSVSVLLRSEERASLADTPLQHGARRLYLAAVAAGAGYSALALLLSLLQAAPGRTTLLARLRTMGMTRSQARRLVLLEMLPQVLLGAVGGVLVGLAVIPLLGPGIDLRALTFGTEPRDITAVDFGLGLRANPWALALPSAGLLILACAVLLAQAWLAGRRRESTELRAGDRV
ncbi:ABC transporter permease [Streptomyces sp. NBC_00669]|uniref:ABC transporter permease n=1 Tax=Streptomyces sp. NBC_00669 TaxID=2976011 RepID=UPI002E3082DF|nr:ABC transporter permease [Streptomyces sp. NBC_00669]